MDLKQRLKQVITKDKENNPKYLVSVIKSDFYYLINSYFEVNFDDIEVEIDLDQDVYNIALNCKGDRIKIMKSLPD